MENKIENAEFDNQKIEVGDIIKFIKGKIENFKNRIQSPESDEGNIEGLKTFSQLEEVYNKMLSAGRYNKALSTLKTMCEKVSTESEKFKLKGYILSSMLMGIIKNNSKKDTIKSFSNMAKKLGFGPLSWITDIDHPEKVLNLLNGISEGDKKVEKLSDVVDSNIKDHMYSSPWGYDYGEFDSKFQKYWDKNGEKILKYIDSLGMNIKEKK